MSNTTTTTNTANTENEHLLENKWILWYRPPTSHPNQTPQAKAWENSQKELFSCTTVEEFWRGYKNLPRISPSHPVNCDYSLFKDGVKPMWEDDFNKNGGRWTYTIERRGSQPMYTLIEQAWLDVLLLIIGEGFDPHGGQIAGGVCGIRQPKKVPGGDAMVAKIHIWTKDANANDVNLQIGNALKKVLNAPEGSLAYSSHDSNTSSKGRGGGGQLKI